MFAKCLAVVVGLALTAVLWGCSSDGNGPWESKRWGLFGYKDVVVVGWNDLYCATSGSVCVPVKGARYDTRGLAVTAAITGMVWGAVGLIICRLGKNGRSPSGVYTQFDDEAF
jgi:hypothetical protein